MGLGNGFVAGWGVGQIWGGGREVGFGGMSGGRFNVACCSCGPEIYITIYGGGGWRFAGVGIGDPSNGFHELYGVLTLLGCGVTVFIANFSLVLVVFFAVSFSVVGFLFLAARGWRDLFILVKDDWRCGKGMAERIFL